ncbi:MAG: amidohydrolase family protein [Dehalococcoidia bacterium]
MIIDTHVHVVAPDQDRYPFGPAGGFRMRGLGSWHTRYPVSAEQLIDTIAGAGVNRAVIVQPFSAYGFDNSYHADSAAAHPDRFGSVCTVDPVAADGAERLTFWVRERGMQGLRLTTSQEGSRLDDPRAYPVWERARELGIPVCVLTSPEHWLAARVMASRFSGVPVLLDHAGGMGAGESDALVDELIGLADLPNVRLKVSTVNFAPLAALGEVGLSRWRRIVAAYGAERLLWGSNYPVSQEGSYADMARLGERALPFLNDTEREAMLGGNALHFWPAPNGR